MTVGAMTSCDLVADCVSLTLLGVVVVDGELMSSGMLIVSSMLSMELEVSRVSSLSNAVLDLLFLCEGMFYIESGCVLGSFLDYREDDAMDERRF